MGAPRGHNSPPPQGGPGHFGIPDPSSPAVKMGPTPEMTTAWHDGSWLMSWKHSTISLQGQHRGRDSGGGKSDELGGEGGGWGVPPEGDIHGISFLGAVQLHVQDVLLHRHHTKSLKAATFWFCCSRSHRAGQQAECCGEGRGDQGMGMEWGEMGTTGQRVGRTKREWRKLGGTGEHRELLGRNFGVS